MAVAARDGRTETFPLCSLRRELLVLNHEGNREVTMEGTVEGGDIGHTHCVYWGRVEPRV